MRALILIVIVLNCVGCGLFNRNTSSSFRAQTEATENLKSASRSDLQTETVIREMSTVKDTVDADYTLQFYPDGKIEFAIDGTFSGAFDSIRMTGKQRKLRSSQRSGERKTTAQTSVSKQTEATGKMKSSTKSNERKSKPDVILWLVIMVVMLFLLFFYKKGPFDPSKFHFF